MLRIIKTNKINGSLFKIYKDSDHAFTLYTYSSPLDFFLYLGYYATLTDTHKQNEHSLAPD